MKLGFVALSITLLTFSATASCVVDDDVVDDEEIVDDDELSTTTQALATCTGTGIYSTTLTSGNLYGTATAPPPGYPQNLALQAALSAAGKAASSCSCPAGTTQTKVPGSFCGAAPSLTYCWKVPGTTRYWKCTVTGQCQQPYCV